VLVKISIIIRHCIIPLPNAKLRPIAKQSNVSIGNRLDSWTSATVSLQLSFHKHDLNDLKGPSTYAFSSRQRHHLSYRLWLDLWRRRRRMVDPQFHPRPSTCVLPPTVVSVAPYCKRVPSGWLHCRYPQFRFVVCAYLTIVIRSILPRMLSLTRPIARPRPRPRPTRKPTYRWLFSLWKTSICSRWWCRRRRRQLRSVFRLVRHCTSEWSISSLTSAGAAFPFVFFRWLLIIRYFCMQIEQKSSRVRLLLQRQTSAVTITIG
jgi:hypothetical protein